MFKKNICELQVIIRSSQKANALLHYAIYCLFSDDFFVI